LHDAQRSILAFSRHAPSSGDTLFVICNFTPVVRHQYRLGVPTAGYYQEILNSDAQEYGGGGIVNEAQMEAMAIPSHQQPYSIEFTLPPLAVVFIKKSE
jgi:1,4-alpha-glucan branching enzyme